MISDRPIPDAIAAKFIEAVRGPSDIFEHLPLLQELASRCDHVTEFGVRGGEGSTIAFLAAQPDALVSYDIHPGAIVSPVISAYLAAGSLAADGKWRVGRTYFQPRVGDTLAIPPETTDLLFIDTLHTAAQLKAELIRHADPVLQNVKKYLVFHDTATFGYAGEDGTEPGLRAVIRWFQLHHAKPLWELIEDRKNCNGLAVLRRIDVRE